MIIKMLSRGAVVVAGMMATQAALDKLEKSWLKREKNIKNSRKGNEKTYQAKVKREDGSVELGILVKADNREDAESKLTADYIGCEITNIRRIK